MVLDLVRVTAMDSITIGTMDCEVTRVELNACVSVRLCVCACVCADAENLLKTHNQSNNCRRSVFVAHFL